MISIFSHTQISDKLKIDKLDLKSEKIKGFDRIDWKSDYTTREIGNPELPVYRVSYVLPIDAVVTGVSFKIKEKEKLERQFDIFPVQEPMPTENTKPQQFAEQNNTIYSSTAPYPNKLYDIESDEIFQGYHILTLSIYPFEYIPKVKVLNFYSNLEYSIEYGTGTQTNAIKPLTQNVRRAEQCKSFVKSLVQNPDDVDKFGSNAQTLRNGKQSIQNSTVPIKVNVLQKTKALSILDEIVPDYIIITNNALQSTFQTLADWKTKKGIFTIIKTTEDINTNYSGSDLQEKIRNYLIEAYSKWGAGLYVLLGGSINVVPTRLVGGTYDNSRYPADLYFATNVGTWNANKNNLYNESTDASDFSTGLILGRAPVKSSPEASVYVNKVITYEKATNISDINYLKNNLYSDAYMEPNNPTPLTSLYTFAQSYIKSDVTSYVPSVPTGVINNRFICDNATCSGNVSRYSESPCPGGDIELNRDNFLSALNSGSGELEKFHFIYHMDHGGSQGISTSGIEKGNSVNKVDMGSLTNGTSYQILMSGSCHSANFTEDCVAQYYLTNPNGGGVVWIGNTDVGRVSEYNQLKYFCKALYKTGGFINNGRYDIGSIFQYTNKAYCYNNEYWRLHLLGDPEMQVWTNTPQTLNVTVGTPAVLLGEQEADVTISNLPSGQKALICVQKGTEVYATLEVSSNGTFYLPFIVNTPGAINVTVTAHNFFPYETTIQAQSTADPHPYVESIDLSDGILGVGIGNGNGKNDAGETIEIGLKIKNNGVNTLDNATVTLCDFQPYITFTNQNSCNSYNVGTLNSGESAYAYFNYTVNKKTPEILSNAKNPITLGVTIYDENNYSWVQNFNIDVYNDSIMQRSKTIASTSNGNLTIEPNETVTFNIDLQNIGQATSTGLTAILTSTSPTNIVQSCSNTSRSYPTIAQFETKTNNSVYQFTTGSAYTSASQLNFNLQVTNAYGKTWNFPFNLNEIKPASVSNLDFTADLAEIDLSWTPLSSILGYNIYRCNVGTDDIETSYVKLNNIPVTASFFNDIQSLDTLTKYYYKVSAISTTGIEGATTRILTWTSYPKKYLFPVTMDALLYNFSSPINVADINYDGKKEIFAGTKGGTDKGYLVGLDYYGNDLFNIDNNVTTHSGYAKLGYEPWAIPAIGDLNRVGKYQIIEPTRSYQQDNTIFCYSANDENPVDGKPDLAWSNLVSQKQFIRGAVLSNIDNSADGSMEIVTCSDERGGILIYNSSGTLITIISCSNAYGALAVADIDNDGDKEIIHAYGSEIHVWHHNGTNFNGATSTLYNLSLSGYRFVSSIIVCDIDSDGQKEILTFATNKVSQSSPFSVKLFAIKTNGSLVSGLDGTPTGTVNNYWNESQEFAVGDVNNDGNLEIVTLCNNHVQIWNKNGQAINPISAKDIPEVTPAQQPLLADVDGDSNIEIVYCSNVNSNIYAIKLDGSMVLGFPLRAQSGVCGGLNISDVDNDGKNELLATSLNRIEMWQTNGLPSKIEWGSERHDQYNTGEYQTICDPTIINSDTTWNSSQSLCGDLILKSGTLTINNSSNISMSSSSIIIVMSGASLVIDAANVLNANIRAMAGSTVVIKNNGKIILGSNAEFYTETGTNLEILYGSIDK